MKLKTRTSHQPDANETLSDLVYRNRRTFLGHTTPSHQPAPVERVTEPVITTRHRTRPWVGILAGMLLTLALWIGLQQGVIPAFSWMNDQWHYGDNRITQLDANVGHGGVSHFVAEYYHGSIVVIELSLTHPNTYHVYTLTGMIGATNTPLVKLSIQDVNHDGKPDLIVQVQGTTFDMILYNTGTAFSESEN